MSPLQKEQRCLFRRLQTKYMTTEVSRPGTLLSSGQKKIVVRTKNIVLRTKKVGTSPVYGLRPSMFIELYKIICVIILCGYACNFCLFQYWCIFLKVQFYVENQSLVFVSFVLFRFQCVSFSLLRVDNTSGPSRPPLAANLLLFKKSLFDFFKNRHRWGFGGTQKINWFFYICIIF